jgi:lysozyme
MKENLNKLLRLEESVERSAYQDSKGYWTIGVGRLIDKRKGGGLSPDEISYLLNNDINEKSTLLFDAIPWIVEMPEPVQGALVSMAFQMGVDGLLGFKTTLGLLKERKFEEAATQMLKSKWAKVDSPNRAKRVAEQVRTQSWVFPK